MSTSKAPGELFPCLLRMCEEVLQDHMQQTHAMLCGAFAVMQHMLPQELLWYLGSEYRTDNIDLRVSDGLSQTFAKGLVESLNKEMLNAFDTPGLIHSSVYMLDYVCRQLVNEHTIMESQQRPPAALFGYVKVVDGTRRYTRVFINARSKAPPRNAVQFTFMYINELPLTQFRDQYTNSTSLNGFSKVAGKRTLQNDFQRMLDNNDVKRTSKEKLNDSKRLELLTHKLPIAFPNLVHVLSLKDAETVRLGKGRYVTLSLAHKKILLDSEFVHGDCQTLLDVVYAYSVSSSPYNVACFVSNFTGEKLKNTQVMPPQQQHPHWHDQKPHCMVGSSYLAVHAALKRAALKIFCGTHQLMKTLHPAPLNSKQTRFTVFRAVDYFQPLYQDAKDLYNVDVPFDISNMTMSSTSLFEDRARLFLKGRGTRFLLVLQVPFFFRRFIAMGLGGLSHFLNEKEILFPDDVIFRINERVIDRWEGGMLVRLHGFVTSDKKGEDLCKGIVPVDKVYVDSDGKVEMMGGDSQRMMSSRYQYPTRRVSSKTLSLAAPALQSKSEVNTQIQGPVPTLKLIDLSVFGPQMHTQTQTQTQHGSNVQTPKLVCGLTKDQNAALSDGFLQIANWMDRSEGAEQDQIADLRNNNTSGSRTSRQAMQCNLYKVKQNRGKHKAGKHKHCYTMQTVWCFETYPQTC